MFCLLGRNKWDCGCFSSNVLMGSITVPKPPPPQEDWGWGGEGGKQEDDKSGSIQA